MSTVVLLTCPFRRGWIFVCGGRVLARVTKPSVSRRPELKQSLRVSRRSYGAQRAGRIGEAYKERLKLRRRWLDLLGPAIEWMTRSVVGTPDKHLSRVAHEGAECRILNFNQDEWPKETGWTKMPNAGRLIGRLFGNNPE